MWKFPLFALLWAGSAWPQDALSLKDAVRIALETHPAVAAGAAGVQAAQSRIQQARGGYLPKVNYLENFARSDNPVFVFSSLLTQQRFTEQNFQLGPLNRPSALNNFQSQLIVEQNLYDAGQTRQGVHAAELERDISAEQQRRTRMDVIAGVVRTYFGAVLAAESLHTAEEAVRSAQADLDRARTVRDAGMSTDADVLSIEVHLAGVREQQIRRRADLHIARASLNEALGQPLDTPHHLTSPLAPAPLPDTEIAQEEKTALAERPEARQTRFLAGLAETRAASAKAAYLPLVFVRGVFEASTLR